jgi:hypothetical protein
MIAVAKRFNVSGSYLARVCSRLNVPRPARGYWAKLTVGKAPTKPTLPEARAGDEVTWDPEGSFPEVARAARPTPSRADGTHATKAAMSSKGQHELIFGAKNVFLAGRESRWSNYLKPAKKLLPEIHVTKAALDAALEFADALFKQLEQRGHRVTLASVGEQIHRPEIDTREKPDKRNHHVDLWSPARCTVVYVGGTAIGLAIFELTESTQMRYVNGTYIREKDYVPPKSKWARDSTWTSTQDIACGRFSLLAYTSYYTKKWSHAWKEVRVGDFIKRASQLALEIERCQAEAAETVELGKRAAEDENIRHEHMRRTWQEEQEKLRIQTALTESKAELHKILTKYAERKLLDDFFLHIAPKLQSLDEPTRRKLDDHIAQARILYQSDRSFEDFIAWISPAEKLKSPK